VNAAPTRTRADGTGPPAQPLPKAEAGPFALRAFAREKRDLEFQFAANDRPLLVTEILIACLRDGNGLPPEVEEAWNLSVSRRTEYLLRLAMAGRKSGLPLILKCPGANCGQALEIELPVADVIALQRRAEERDLLEWRPDGDSVRVRRPTGSDQRSWRTGVFPSFAKARSAIVRALVVEGDETLVGSNADSVTALEAELGGFDPLAAFSIRVVCSLCGSDTNHGLDLEAVALRELEKIQLQLLEEVHRLAIRYHWSEDEVLGVAPERRSRYLRFIEAEAAA
jgi:hypothetical protein